MEAVAKIAELKYPKGKEFRHCWIFDHSRCHAARSEDALDVSQLMRNTIWMLYSLGVPKGMRIFLQERGVNTTKMNADEMRGRHTWGNG